ncbi:MAG: methionyl-tRNA formyltransferase [Clostridia bacterium]
MNVIFLGTPKFAVAVLDAILASSHKVAAVVTQPDRVNARGGKIIFSPVKVLALEQGLPVLQFENISKEGADILRALGADIMVTAAYGQILSQQVLDICKHGVINCHASILPKYRGASPVQAALLNGDRETGVSIMQTVQAVDAGDVILIEKLTLSGEENAEECLAALSHLGGRAVVKALGAIADGSVVFSPQDQAQATFSKKLKKEDGKLNFNKNAEELNNIVRAFAPKPSAYLSSPHGALKVLRAAVIQGDFSGQNGEVLNSDKNGFIIKCAKGVLSLLEVQGEGGKVMPFDAYLRGRPIAKGTVLV